MVFLYNSFPFLIVILMGLIIRYAVPSKVGKFIFALITVGMLFVYFQIQPSYMPKGSVKPLPVADFKIVDKPMVDRMLKTKPAAERDAEMQAEYDKSDARREAFVEKIKSEKE